MFYDVNPVYGAEGIDPNTPSYAILVRYIEGGNGVADPTSATILFGSAQEGPIDCSNSHLAGDLAFARDGTLFLSHGDGARWEWPDDGTNPYVR